MELPKIANFESLLGNILSNKKKYISSEVKPLTAPGDNYASLILAIKLVFENENSEKEEIHTVAKLLTPNDFMQGFMNIAYTVRNELAFYQTILPALRNFQKTQTSKQALEFFPKFYGGRLSLDATNKTIDENSVILLENLKTAGYGLFEKKDEGYDLETTKLILEKMAELHGTIIALKEQKPEIFEKELMVFFDEFRIFQMGNDEEFMTCDVVTNGIIKAIEGDEFCNSHMNRVRETMRKCVENLKLPKNAKKFQKDVFATLVHVDLWVNNIMVKTHMGKIVEVKLLDWQLFEYASVAKDLIFFLCSSASKFVFIEKFDEILDFYYNCLIKNLVELKCNIAKFGKNVFYEEFGRVTGDMGFLYVMMAIPSIFATGGHVWEIHEITKERLLDQIEVSDICRDRIQFITRKFIEKGWI